ncbi:hypothetical protein MC885_001954 [Smutsia gigantea]|nr:hypothetical protein MC885_001954 [Smutsia gigantea]
MEGLVHQERMGYLGHQESLDLKATEDRKEKEESLGLGFQGVRGCLGLQLRVCRAHPAPPAHRAPQDLVGGVTQKTASILRLVPVRGQKVAPQRHLVKAFPTRNTASLNDEFFTLLPKDYLLRRGGGAEKT